jgi:alpha-tubulin suppressor-like RCC1 family protein
VSISAPPVIQHQFQQRAILTYILYFDYNRNPDLLEPHILRSLGNVKITSVHASCAGCHFVAIDIDGHAWLFGRNGFSCLGVSGEDYISENAPRMVKASELGAPKGTKFVHAACGRNHTLLVGSNGEVWSAGVNNLGQVRCLFHGER